MKHVEILAKAEAWRRGELSRLEQTEFTGHLKACPACRELVGKWPQTLPLEGLTGRVMARLSQAPSLPAQRWGLGFASLAAGLAAVLLVVAAFWHPERRWLEEDKYFAGAGHSGPVAAAHNDKEGFYE